MSNPKPNPDKPERIATKAPRHNLTIVEIGVF